MGVRPSKRRFVILPSIIHNPESVLEFFVPVFRVSEPLLVKFLGLGLLSARPFGPKTCLLGFPFPGPPPDLLLQGFLCPGLCPARYPCPQKRWA